jgi:hypothetical protein
MRISLKPGSDLDAAGIMAVFAETGHSLRLLVHNSQGFWLCQKRLCQDDTNSKVLSQPDLMLRDTKQQKGV